MAKVISFASQKGGVGKSTLLMLTATALHKRTNSKVLIIDCDPQKSVKETYQTDKDTSNGSCDVITYNWNQPKPEVNFDKTLALAESKYDVIFLDLPGKLEGADVRFSLLISDIIIVPIVASTLDINATISFLKKLPEISKVKKEKGYDLKIFGVINKKDQTIEHNKLQELAGIGGIQLFYSPISYLVRYKRNISTSEDITNPMDIEDEFNQYFDEFRTKCEV